MIRWLGAFVVATMLGAWSAFAQTSTGSERAEKAVLVSAAALGQRIPDAVFTRSDGKSVRISDYAGRPLLVSMIYTGCIDVCPTLLESLYPAVNAARNSLGADSFSVITVGFDAAADSPARMESFARARGINLPNWDFLAGDEANVSALARAVGFAYYARAGGWDHLAQVSVIDKDGLVYNQVYGSAFEPPLIVDPLKALVFDRRQPLSSMTALINRVKYFCTVYDPSSGRYYFNYSLFMSIAIGIFCFGGVLTVLLREWRRAIR